MVKIFISYRRDDSADATGRLKDHLEAHFGADEIFYDVDNIPLGVDFRKHLSDAVGHCDVLLAIIGENWLTAAHTADRRRLDDPRDFVRIELEAALSRDIPVIPVLVGRGQMPSDDDLPASLKDLAFRNATEVRSGADFRSQVERLIRGMERLQASSPRSPSAPSESKPTVPTPPSSAPVPTVEVMKEIACPLCVTMLQVPETQIGKQMSCPFCSTKFVPKDSNAGPKCQSCGSALIPGLVACRDCGLMLQPATTATPAGTEETPNLCVNPGCAGVLNPAHARNCARCGSPLPTVAGTLLHKRYRIEKLMAMGGFGGVYQATDTKFGQTPVAVKDMICSDPGEFAIRLSFFRREAEILRLLSNVPAVPRLYDMIEEGQSAYIVMELLKGRDLLRIMEENNNQPFPFDKIIMWGMAACDVLQAMHSLDPPWIHRDIKTDNLFLMDDGSMKLIDFGTARCLGKATKERMKPMTRVYTEGFAPPEQIVGKPVPRSDLFALAATLYQLVTGKQPEGFYSIRDIEEILNRTANPIPQDQRWFYELLSINLSDDVNERYHTAQSFKADLEKRRLTRGVLCRKCRQPNKPRVPYCTACNAPLTPKTPPCQHCEFVNRMGSILCKQCGSSLWY